MPDLSVLEVNGVAYDLRDPTKASNGYGLGEQGSTRSTSDRTAVDSFKLNGWAVYYNVDNVPLVDGISSHACLILVEMFNWNFGRQTAYTLTGVVLERTYFSGTWTPWDCRNPPMVLGVEYRTTERWNGKAVYTKLVNCGALPAAGAAVHYGIGYDITKILRVNGVPSTQGFTVPYISTDAFITVSGTVYDGRAYIVVYVDRGELAEDECIVQAWYIKD